MYNGGEFTNSTFTSMLESLGISIKITEVESSRGDDLGERYNAILTDILHKVLQVINFDLESIHA